MNEAYEIDLASVPEWRINAAVCSIVPHTFQRCPTMKAIVIKPEANRAAQPEPIGANANERAGNE